MKKIIFFLLLIPGIIFSQTTAQNRKIVAQTNTRQLRELSLKYKQSFNRNKQLAEQLAKVNHWQTSITDGNSFSELVGVTKDYHPIYYSTYNQGAGITSRANKLYNGGGLGLDIEGQNMVTAMWDAGSALASHELFSGRLLISDDSHENRSHSTHVAGTIIGSDQFQGGLARGMAFKATLHSYDWDNDEAEVAEAASEGLLLSNHSYGYSPFATQDYQWGKYDGKSKDYDEIMFNAPYYQFVCAAGNSRGDFNLAKNGFDLITGHGVSKNGITVGAVEEVLNYTGPNSVVMSSTSSWGPTDDGRIKPDIVAKGVDTFSSTNVSDHTYGVSSGTSMACPSVEGTLLLLQQYYDQLHGSFMRAATLKGLMIHTADEAGLNPGPDYSFGWGLINAEKAANVITKKGLQSYILENSLAQGNTYSIAVNAMGNEPLLATLCWTDPKGNVHSFNADDNTPDLVNDLDLRITQLEDTYYPWKLNGSNPAAAATKGDNVVDNVEKAEIANPSGNYLITVSHKGNLTNNIQDYSLIVSGIILKNFWFTTTEATKNICHPANTASYDFALNLRGDFSEDITFSTPNIPNGITANFSQPTMNANGNFNLTLGNLSALAPGNYPFTIRGQSNSDVFELTAVIHILGSDFTAVTLQQPGNNSIAVLNPVTFRWLADQNAQQYEIAIATDSNFTNIVETATVTTATYISAALNNDTTYFWKVRSSNQCGIANYGTPFSFRTACIMPSNTTLIDIKKNTVSIGWTSVSDSWNYEVVAHDATPTGSGTPTNSNPLTITNLLPNTCYDFYFKNTCSTGGPNWSEPFTFCTTPDYCGGDHFFDSGGANGDYHDNEDKTTVIFPDNSGNRVRAVFNDFELDNGGDYLIVFNGPDDTYPFMRLANGVNSPGSVASTDVSGALTFVFHSNGNDHGDGWDASIICEPLPACPNAPDNFVLSNATTNAATIQWQDHSNSTSWEIEVTPHNANPTGIPTNTAASNPFVIGNLSQNTCYDFYIRSLCSGGSSGWAGPFAFCTQADYCAGDHFYDSGGSTGNYQNYEFKTTVIAPQNPGDRIKAVFNDFDVRDGDSFVVYNGPDIDSPVLYDNQNNTNAPGTLSSTDATGMLTFAFSSDGFDNDQGWDAAIICENMPPCATFPSHIHTENTTISSATIEWDNNCNPVSWEVELVAQGVTPTGIGSTLSDTSHTFSGLTSNTCYDFYIRSICSGGDSAWSAPYTFCTKANYCAGDHFYDSGGANGNYSNGELNTTVIYPDSAGNRVRAIVNSLNIDNDDRLKIYNGPTRNYPLLFNSGTSETPGTYVSTHTSGALTFVFSSNDHSTRSGWDISISCETLPPCSNPPSAIHVTSVSSTAAKLEWNENSNATTWDVKVTPHNSVSIVYLGISGTNSSQIGALNSNTCYDFYVRSTCGDTNSAWTPAYLFCTEPDYCNGTRFYDSGGPTGNYANNEDKTTIIYPGSAGERVRALFYSYELESCCDYLKIYNGPNTSYPLLYNDASTSPGSVASTDISGALTFEFHSDDSSNYSGWDAAIFCEAMPACQNSPTNITASDITIGGATLSWTENGSATAWQIEIVLAGTLPNGNGADVNASTFALNELSSNTCYDFYVRSVCSSGTTGWAGPYSFCTLPDYCGGDHFYDSGGPNNNYQNSENSIKVINPGNPGESVSVTFLSFNLESCCDYLRIYNGATTSSPLLFSGGGDSPGTVASTESSGALTFEFFSDNNANAAGWDATISCTPLSVPATGAPFHNIEYYPNPVSRLLAINAHERVKKYTVYDVAGKLLWETPINQEKFEIDMQQLSTGNYFIKLTNQSGAITKTIKVLKK